MNFDNNAAAQQVIRFINGTNRSVFLTGKAGTGKTTLLKSIVENCYKNIVIVAPTGIAALNAGGVTIHSMFQIPPSCFAPITNFEADEEISFALLPLSKIPKETRNMNKIKRGVLRQMDLLVIDEVSMLRADLLDAIDTALKYIRRNQLQFGGVQVLFIGDMLQLPPIVRDDEWNLLKRFYPSMYFFDAIALRDKKPLIFELEHIYRQSDKLFIDILNNLRQNIFVRKDVNELNKHFIPDFKPSKKTPYIFITTHNKKAAAINHEKFEAIKKKTYSFKAEIKGSFPENLYPVDSVLDLKIGARIMFIKNDYQQGRDYFNGKIGDIYGFEDNGIQVIFPETGKIVDVELFTWENIRYFINKDSGQIEEETLGTFTMYPIKLAWAVTIHKSQGLTFPRAIIDVSEAFAPGQIYVALSRLESLDGLVLSEPIVDDYPEQDKRVLQFTTSKLDNEHINTLYEDESQQYLTSSILSAFNFHPVFDEFESNIAEYNNDESQSIKRLFLSSLLPIKAKTKEMTDVADKFKIQITSSFNKTNLGYIKERIIAANNYFMPLFKNISKELYLVAAEASLEKRTSAFVNDLKNIEALFFNTQKNIEKCLLMTQAAIDKKLFSKETLSTNIDTETRQETLFKNALEHVKSKHKKNKDYKKARLDTKEISFEMYSDGLSVEEIANDRDLKIETICHHLEYFVAEGMIPVSDFVADDVIKDVKDTVKKLNSRSVGEIKTNLPDYSYQEIRFVLASMESLF